MLSYCHYLIGPLNARYSCVLSLFHWPFECKIPLCVVLISLVWCVLQLPLPDHMEEKVVCNSVTPQKDVDGFHVINVGR